MEKELLIFELSFDNDVKFSLKKYEIVRKLHIRKISGKYIKTVSFTTGSDVKFS